MLKKLITFAVLIGAAFLLPVVEAQTLISSTNWTAGSTGSTSTGSAGSTTGWGNGWIDNYGGLANITSSSPYYAQLKGTTSPAANNQVIIRPTSENVINEEEVYYWVFSNTTTYNVNAVLSFQGSGTMYQVGQTANAGTYPQWTSIYKVVSGTTTALGTHSTFSPAPSNGDVIRSTTTRTVSGSTSTLTITDYDTATSTQIGTETTTDSTSGLQGAGQIGVFATSTTSAIVDITQIQTYNDISQSFTVSPTSVMNSGSETLTLVGTGTSWTSGTTFSISGISGALLNGLGSGAVPTTFNSGTQTATLTLTNPTSAGTLTIADSIDAATNTITVTAPATGYTTSGPSSGTVSVASSNFTITPNGTYSGTITPSISSGPTGTISPSSLTWSGTSTGQTFTFTPTTTGTSVITSASSPSVTNSTGSLSYSVNAGPQTIPINSSSIFWSPAAWVTNSGRSAGTTYEQTNQQGSYCRFYFTGSSSPTCSVTFDCSMYAGVSPVPQISYSVDGVFTDNIALSSSGSDSVSIPVTGATPHIITIWCRNLEQLGGWAGTASTGNNAFRIDNFTIDGSSTAGTAPSFTGTNNWVYIVGPSTCAGTYANTFYPSATELDDELLAYSHLEGEAFRAAGYEYAVKAFGYWGWLATGDSDSSVPGFYKVTGSSGGTGGTYASGSSWNKLDPNNSILDSNNDISAYGGTNQQPYIIQVNFGGNENRIGSTSSDVEASVTQSIVALRAAAPNAWIFVGPEQEMASTAITGAGATDYTYIPYIDLGVNNYISAHPSDTKIKLLDLTGFLSNTIISPFYLGSGPHSNAFGHAVEGHAMLQYIENTVSATTSGGIIGRGRTPR
jgi:hypothetical protein